MKSLPFLVFILLLVLIPVACAPEVSPTPIMSTIPVIPSPTAEPTAVPLPFTPATYQAEAYGFELEYPDDWTAIPISEVGSRGSSGQLFSPGASAESLPPGSTRVGITIYLWDPKKDLAAYAEHRKSAWDAGGSMIVSESAGDLVDGRKYMGFMVRAPDGLQAFFLLTILGEKYLEISGEGDLVLVEQIAHTVRPLGVQP